ncbi:ATP-binding protein [Frankia sp. R82]|uniref:ATP-binding response regulator n=1 Tax=Frankia sp. R82 TaxID=2950553 RepID=UPI0020435CFF|nr:ATP-binding protein [Frankia sp. R82]MCM3882313.1 ATP-binding protein [Frankia sp. R82]
MARTTGGPDRGQAGGPAGEELTDVASLHIADEADVFTARQIVRVTGAEIGLDSQDQVRLATAVSEVGREALAAGGASVTVGLRAPATLTITIVARNPFPAEAAGLLAAARLVDTTVAAQGSARTVVLAKFLPTATRLETVHVARLRRALAATAPVSRLDELRIQNDDLVNALAELKENQSELVRLNAELEETNRGVMALYGQLSTELEETNRGVVALYAELDERGMALERANEAKTRFLRNVSHELRAPVTSVLGLARLLLDPTGDPLSTEQRRQADLILASSGDLLTLVNDLLDLAKAESGHLDTAFEEVDVSAMLATVEGSMRPLATRAAVRLVFDVPADIGPLRTDESLLCRILRNLVTNALKFTEQGEVRVSVRGGNPLVFAVSDTGIGIGPADAERVFDEFYQVRTHLHAQVRGTGLGLPYARRVATLLGGRLDLDSAVGAGSTFTVALPREPSPVPEPVAAGEADDTTATSPPPAPVPLALIVDDDPAFRTALRTLLVDRAARVVESGDGDDALRLMRAERPDIVFLDLLLPGRSGGEVLSVMNDDSTLRDVPVAVVTWSDHSASASHGALDAAVAVLAKSTLSQVTIDAALRRAVGQRR